MRITILPLNEYQNCVIALTVESGSSTTKALTTQCNFAGTSRGHNLTEMEDQYGVA